MSRSGPKVLINGIGRFFGKKLAEKILENEVEMVAAGEYRGGLAEKGEIRVVGDWREAEEETFDYIFDLEGDEELWQKTGEWGGRLTVVMVGEKGTERMEGRLRELTGVNWRMVRAEGVYGVGMAAGGGRRDFLVRNLELAAENKNLVLPPAETEWRWLAEEDLAEGVLRAAMASGTEGRRWRLEGEKVGVREIAEALIEEAKMTRTKVLIEEIAGEEEFEAEKEWEDLGWSPKRSFREGIRETLQYFLAKKDEESRRAAKPNFKFKISNFETQDVGREEERRESARERVEVEEEEKITNYKSQITKIEPESRKVEIEEEGVGEKVRKWEIEPILVKNSNLRQLKTEEETEVEKIKPAIIEKWPKEEPKKESKKRFNRKYIVAGGIGIAVVVAGWLAIVPIGIVKTIWGMAGAAKEGKELIVAREYRKAERTIDKAISKTKEAEEKIDVYGWNRWLWGRRAQTLLRTGEQGLGLEKKLVGLAEKGRKVGEAVLNEEEIDWKKEWGDLEKGLEEAEREMAVTEARLGGDWRWLPEKGVKYLQELKKEITEGKELIILAGKAAKWLPDFLGIDGKRREYLVVFQNENELRPGGGFIGSYGILSFEGGRLANLEVKDIYEADGQLKGHVEPPEEIKKYLGEGGWYMRDANWQASFPLAAKDVQWFFEKETGRRVDGVIGINLAAAKALVGVVGEIEVPDFKEKINKNNLYEQAEFYAETKFFPGSNQKASFLGGMARQLFEEVKGLGEEKKMAMMKETLDLLERNEIQIVVNNKETAMKVAEMGWDGAMYQGKCTQERCVADYFWAVEANLGVNKANYFIYRNMEKTVEVGEKLLVRTVRINYENTAKNKNWPGGDYKNYLRIYLPREVKIEQVAVVNSQKPEERVVFTGESLKISETGGRKEVGFLVEVPVGEKRTAEIRYSSQLNLGGKEKFSYLDYIQKQSGYGDTGLVVLVSFPEGWQPLQAEPVGSVVNGKLLFNMKLERDIRLGVEIGK